MEIGFEGGGPEGAKFGEWRGDEGLAVDRDFKAVAAGGSDACGEEVVLAGDGVDFGEIAGVGGDEDGGSGLGKETEERMSEERRILLDGSADAFGECGLRQSNGDAAVGDVAR